MYIARFNMKFIYRVGTSYYCVYLFLHVSVFKVMSEVNYFIVLRLFIFVVVDVSNAYLFTYRLHFVSFLILSFRIFFFCVWTYNILCGVFSERSKHIYTCNSFSISIVKTRNYIVRNSLSKSIWNKKKKNFQLYKKKQHPALFHAMEKWKQNKKTRKHI